MYSSLINNEASQLHRKNSFREKAVSKLTSSSFDGSKTSAGREGLKQTTGWVRSVTYDFACSTTQPSAVEGSGRWKYATDNTAGLPNYTFQLNYITGRSACKPDTDTKT